MKYIVEIICDNAAFEEGTAAREIARILKSAAIKLVENETPYSFSLRDINGNRVGSTRIEQEGE